MLLFQIHPLDYNTDEFYENRREQINLRIELIKKWEANGFSVAETITEHWNKYEGVACTGMNWERFSSLQQALVNGLKFFKLLSDDEALVCFNLMLTTWLRFC